MAREELRTVLGTPAGTETRFHPFEIDVTTRDPGRRRRAWPPSDSDQAIRRRFWVSSQDRFRFIPSIGLKRNRYERYRPSVSQRLNFLLASTSRFMELRVAGLQESTTAINRRSGCTVV